MKSSRGYGAYRGRNRVPRVLKAIIMVLAIVLALTVAAYFLLKPYMVYTDNGVYISLPFFHGNGGSTDITPTPEDEPQAITQQDGEPAGQAEDDTDEGNTDTDQVVVDEPTSQSPEDGGVLHGIALSLDALTDGTAAEQLSNAGANTAIFDMKADSGQLGYVSALSVAETAGVSSATADINQTITTFNKGDYYTIARVSCFKDDAVAAATSSLAISTSSRTRWSDADGIRWLNPYYAATQTYVIDICVELAQLGFDEILLDNCFYPTDGDLDNIKTGSSYQSSIFSVLLDTFYGDLKSALAQYDIKIDIVTDTDTLTNGENSTSGQTAELLAAYADRVFVADDFSAQSTFVDTLETAGMVDGSSKLVFLQNKAPTDTEHAWAVIESDA